MNGQNVYIERWHEVTSRGINIFHKLQVKEKTVVFMQETIFPNSKRIFLKMQGRGYSCLLLRGFFVRRNGSGSSGHVQSESLKLIN